MGQIGSPVTHENWGRINELVNGFEEDGVESKTLDRLKEKRAELSRVGEKM